MMDSFSGNQNFTSKTPMFGFNMTEASLEKDFANACNWHIRGFAHSHKCVLKIIEAARYE